MHRPRRTTNQREGRVLTSTLHVVGVVALGDLLVRRSVVAGVRFALVIRRRNSTLRYQQIRLRGQSTTQRQITARSVHRRPYGAARAPRHYSAPLRHMALGLVGLGPRHIRAARYASLCQELLKDRQLSILATSGHFQIFLFSHFNDPMLTSRLGSTETWLTFYNCIAATREILLSASPTSEMVAVLC